MREMIDAAHDERKLLRNPDFVEKPEYSTLSAHEPRCECGHGLYFHYMCGGPPYCLTRCGCGQFKPAPNKAK